MPLTAPVPPPNPIADGLAALAVSGSTEDLLRLLTPEGRQSTIVAALAAHAQKIRNLEVYMALTDDKISELTANLQNIQGDIARLNELTPQLQSQVASLQAELEAQDPALAEKLQPLVDLSQQIADATPEPVVVPDPEPTPEPSPEPTPVDDPVPAPVDDQGNPV
jgi:uncharacterized phage infection (PIP) family protein YhgE